VPTIAVDVSNDGARAPISAARVKEIVQTVCRKERVRHAMISVTFVSDRKIARINREFLDHTGATDIITFELTPVNKVVIGDIYIAPGVARENARVHGASVREELVRLVVHGILHVLGYTHPEDEGRTKSSMWRKQERFVASFT
jgi:probable rRNA maturation factor